MTRGVRYPRNLLQMVGLPDKGKKDFVGVILIAD